MLYTDEAAIQNRVQEHYNEVVSLGFEVVGVFLQGSWNYGLGYEDSDVDTKAIIVPTLEDLALGKKPVSTTLVLENGEHIDLKDIRLMFDCYKKQNINFIETLFTKFRVLNPKYSGIFQELFDYKEDIASLDNKRLVYCIRGNLKNEKERVFKETPGTEKNLRKYGCDVKSLSHIIRYIDFFNSYFIEGINYENSLKPFRKTYIMRFKTGDFFAWEVEEILQEYEAFDNHLKELLENNSFDLTCPYKERINNLFDNVLIKIFKKSLGV